MKRISEKEQLKIRINTVKEIRRLRQHLKNKKEHQIINNFKDEFMVCENAYKYVLNKYLILTHNKETDYLKINMVQVPTALKFVGYYIDNELLDKIFGSENHRGKKSVKKLRDALTHQMPEKDVKEVMNRQEELFGYMNNFLEQIENYDKNIA